MFFWSGCQAGVGGWNLAQVSSIKPGDAFNLHLKESRAGPESVPKGCAGTGAPGPILQGHPAPWGPLTPAPRGAPPLGPGCLPGWQLVAEQIIFNSSVLWKENKWDR